MGNNTPRVNGEHHAVADAVLSLLGKFGVAGSQTQTSVLDAANATLTARQHQATAVGVRWKELTVEASGAAARILRADLDQIIAAVNAQHPDSVDRIIVRRPRTRR